MQDTTKFGFIFNLNMLLTVLDDSYYQNSQTMLLWLYCLRHRHLLPKQNIAKCGSIINMDMTSAFITEIVEMATMALSFKIDAYNENHTPRNLPQSST